MNAAAAFDLTFAPHTTTVVELKLVSKGVPYWSRPDLGISADDVKVEGRTMNVTVHSLGAVDAPASKVVLRDRAGKVIATAELAAEGAARSVCRRRSGRSRFRRVRSGRAEALPSNEWGLAGDYADEQQCDAVTQPGAPS